MVIQLTSLYFTQSFFGYQFYAHFDIRGTTGLMALFYKQLVVAILLFCVFGYLLYNSRKLVINYFTVWLRRVVSKSFIIPIYFISTLTGLLIVLLCSSFVADSKTLWPVLASSEADFQEVLKKYNMQDYVLPHNITGKKGQNIIVISLESLERGYLEQNFKGLTPNLNSIKERWNYFEMEQNEGSSWTSGSTYTTLTGFPAYFGVYGNAIFQKSYKSQISSISNVLEKAGYETVFMNGNANFSGTVNMLNVFGFDKVIDKYSHPMPSQSSYGIRDKDLFELAKKEVTQQTLSGSSFFLYLSTTDTHFPEGIYDERMEQFVSKKESDLEFMIAALDYMVGDFISYLETHNLLENTVVYILPDHLKMGDRSNFNENNERGLYVMTNADKRSVNLDSTKTMYQIDLPKFILEGAQVTHNLKFLTDYIEGDKNEFIKNNILEITELNTNGLTVFNLNKQSLPQVSENFNTYKQDTMRFIAHAGGKIKGTTYTNSKEALDLSYKKGFRLFELDIIQTSDGHFVAAHDWKHWSKITGCKGKLPVTKREFLEYKIHNEFTPMDMAAINKWFLEHPDAILVTDKVNDPLEFSKQFSASNRLIMELFDMESVRKAIQIKVKAMPSQVVINHFKEADVMELKKMGVEYVAISRQLISKNNALLKLFRKYDIKPFAYHINFVEGINEHYMLKYEMDEIYGIYADDWEF